jgi:hypothetical protein
MLWRRGLLDFVWVVEWWVKRGRTEREICEKGIEILVKIKDC